MTADRDGSPLLHDATSERAAAPLIFVVIPAFNESPSVGDVVQSVRARFENVIVVDDGSSDDTGERALEAGATVVTHLINRGQGAALKTGVDYAVRCGADVVVTFDADGQHDSDDIAALVAPIVAGDYDVVLGSRFLRSDNKVPFIRRIVLKIGVLSTRLISGIKLTDVHNGLRAFSRSAAQRIPIVLDRMAHASEIVDEVSKLRLRYKEVPVRILYTEYSLRKGQTSAAAFRVMADFILGKLDKVIR
jgi:glycosyltransferase involved in cell wall biosynthesis